MSNPEAYPDVQMTGQRVRGRYDRVEAPLPRAARSGELSRMARSGTLAADARSGQLADIARAPGFQGYAYGDYTPPPPIPRWATEANRLPPSVPGLRPPIIPEPQPVAPMMSTAANEPASAPVPPSRLRTGKDWMPLTDDEAWTRALDFVRGPYGARPSKVGLFGSRMSR